jgi:hypothetical protein
MARQPGSRPIEELARPGVAIPIYVCPRAVHLIVEPVARV